MMVGLDMFNLANNVAQRVLSQSNNISYGVRGASRMNSIPDDRQADYLFRDFYMVIVTAYFTEIAFRMAETMLTIPKFTEAIGFNRMQQLYGKKDGLHGYFPGARNYKSIPETIRPRVLGSLVKDKSNDLIPRVLSDLDLPKMREKLAEMERKGASPKKIEAMRARVAEADLLAHHFRRFFDFKGYVAENLVQRGTVSAKEAGRVGELLDELRGTVDKELQQALHERGKGALSADELKQLQDKITAKTRKVLEKESQKAAKAAEKAAQKANKKAAEEAVAAAAKAAGKLSGTPFDEEVGRNLFAALVDKGSAILKKEEVAKLGDDIEKRLLDEKKISGKARTLLEEGLSSSRTMAALKKIQKNSIWPKMAFSVGISFLYFGVLANNFDTKILQPWQDKLVAERGTAREVVPPFYKALIPGAATLGFLMSNKTAPFMRKLGYFGRFAVAGALALGVYTGTALMGVKRALAKPPAHKPAHTEDNNPSLAGLTGPLPPQNQPLGGLQYRPMGFQLFEMARQMNNGGPNPFTTV